ncbi:MAG TPA: hypothetical protein VLL07_02635, partial [Pontiella sp.]|nr:hypothetical protein [Pontiella sp.]
MNAESVEYVNPANWNRADAAENAGMRDRLDIDFPDMLNGIEMPLSMDFLYESRKGNDRSFHDGDLKLTIGKDNELTILDDVS